VPVFSCRRLPCAPTSRIDPAVGANYSQLTAFNESLDRRLFGGARTASVVSGRRTIKVVPRPISVSNRSGPRVSSRSVREPAEDLVPFRADVLGGKEGFENSRTHVIRIPVPVSLTGARPCHRRVRSNRDASAALFAVRQCVADRVGRVDQKIEQNLIDLSGRQAPAGDADRGRSPCRHILQFVPRHGQRGLDRRFRSTATFVSVPGCEKSFIV